MVVIVVIAVIVVGNKKSSTPTVKPQTSVSATQNNNVESSTKPTTQTTVPTTESLKLNKISNVRTEYYYILEDNVYYGITFSFDPVENADGYKLEYTFQDYDGNERKVVENIGHNQTRLYFVTEQLPIKIEATAFKDKNNSESVMLFNNNTADFQNDVSFYEFNELRSGYYELNPFK